MISIYRSISRNRWHTRFVYRFTVSRFYRFHRFISEDTSLLLFIQKWKLISCNQRIWWPLSCNWESKDQTIYHPFLNRRFKKSKSIKIVSNQVILSIDKGKRSKSYLGKSFSLNFRHPFDSIGCRKFRLGNLLSKVVFLVVLTCENCESN